MDETVSENMQEVALPVDTETSTDAPESQTDEGVSEVQEPPKRDFEKDANFARIRREKEAAQKEIERLKSAMKNLNFTGQNVTEIADEAEALHKNIPVEQVRSERERLDKLEQLQAENEALKQSERERIFKEDLALIKGQYPDVKAKTIEELGPDFIKMKIAGVDTLVAYEAIRAKEARETKPKPPSTGSVKTNAVPESEFFTNEQLDRLTPQQLDDPKIMQKAMASFAKLKK